MPRYPQMFRLRQHFDAPRLDDVSAEVHTQLEKLALEEKVEPGHSVAITVGSRGVANLREIIKATVDHFKKLGASPFIVPAMGSHGGGTAEGQQGVVESYGVTEAYLECPIRSSMETVVVGTAAEGFPVHFDRLAMEADHVVVANRIKPHTRFKGEIESGLLKMMLIGLGKHAGALVYHRAILDYSFDRIIRSVVSEVFCRCNILAGLAIVENAYDQTARIEAVVPEEFESREKELLQVAKGLMARLPFDRVDLLLIDRIGKNLSGTGMDTNIVGRTVHDHEAQEHEYPKVKQIAIRALTPETHGNAVGFGIAEFCKSSLLRATDFEITRINALTAGHAPAAMPPLDYETDREIVDLALGVIGLVEPPDAKIVWIRNTLDLAEVECSSAYRETAQGRDDLEILTPLRDLPFDAAGNLPDFDDLAVTTRR